MISNVAVQWEAWPNETYRNREWEGVGQDQESEALLQRNRETKLTFQTQVYGDNI